MHSEEDGNTENTDSPSARARISTDFDVGKENFGFNLLINSIL